MKKIVSVLILFCIFGINLYSDNKSDSIDAYNRGVEKFQKGAIEDAIKDLNDALNLDNRNFKAQKTLTDVLNVKGKRLIEAEKYDEALETYKTAYRLYPNNQEVADLYKSLRDGSLQESKKQAKIAKNSKSSDVVDNSKTDKDKAEKEKNDSENFALKQAEMEKKYKEELEKQKLQLEKMVIEYSKSPKNTKNSKEDPSINYAKQQIEVLNEMTKRYNETLKQSGDEKAKNMDILYTQLKENKAMMERQNYFARDMILLIVGLFLFFIIIIFVSIIIFLRMLAKRRKDMQRSSPYYGFNPFGMIENPSMQVNNPLMLGYESNSDNANSLKEDGNNEDMYKDLIKLDRLNKMHAQMKSGELSWQTIREYISELEKDLRIEILNIVEIKIMNGDIINYTHVLPVLFPFLTDSDDYLKEKANYLIKHSITNQGGSIGEEKITDPNRLVTAEVKEEITSDSPLDLKNLMKSVEALQSVFGKRDKSIDTAKFARGIAMTLNMAKGDVELLYKTALIHDVGYLYMDHEKLQTILYKTDITDEDFNFIKEHVDKGLEYFGDFDIPLEMKEGILYHHERNDGSGYPKGMKKEEIHSFAKIIGIAETFVALTTERPHKSKLSPESAMAIIHDGARKKFDTEYINALEKYSLKIGIIKR